MTTGTDGGCKVERVAQKYELHNLDDRLLRRRKNEDASLRDLDIYIARLILARAMERAGMDSSAAEHYHHRLSEGDSIKQREARNALNDAGVDVEEAEDDFVSYQTVRKHLNECLSVDTSREEYDPDTAEAAERIARLQTRVQQVTERTIQRLAEHGAVDIDVDSATTSIKIVCKCGRQYDAENLLYGARSCPCTEMNGDESTNQV